ncbi:MAG: pantothenate kinase [Synechocystis sp.]|nr:pantothenate kinase [Synechocystis sp.]
MQKTVPTDHWLALMIGNSHLHWAEFHNNQLRQTWHTPHNIAPEDLSSLLGKIPFVLASVVPSQTDQWLSYQPQILTLDDIPLNNLYSTLGIDRALAALGAGITYGFPCLVIDGGTALTLTAVNDQQCLVGGAILPGLGLQLHTLGDRTAALPALTLPKTLPDRWANNTSDAILSGVIYSTLAGLRDYVNEWLARFPQSSILLTGGDGDFLHQQLRNQNINRKTPLIGDRQLIFRGIQHCRLNL